LPWGKGGRRRWKEGKERKEGEEGGEPTMRARREEGGRVQKNLSD